ncbi:Conserved protein of unknown function [Mycobacterium canettii CIPT 140070010]|nr:Conserved protein of unknown function [Mycobacterium canettii CIPT 140070010]
MPCSSSSREAISHDHTKATPRPVGFATLPNRFAVSAERTHGSIAAPADESAASCDSAPDSANRCQHYYSNNEAASPARTFVAPLIYITDRNNVIAVASALGQAEHPQWHRNLLANPDTHIQIGSDRRAVRAVVASSEERARLGQRPVDAYADFRFLPKLDRA